MNVKWDLTISALFSWLILSPCLGSDFVEYMGNKHECEQYPKEIHWISEKTSALVIGKSEDSVRVCRLKFGLATASEGARVRLNFDFIYNHACGVYLQINESTTNDFFNSTTNREMFMSGCNTNDPGTLFAKPKNFVLISLVKENERMEAFNFRLNISMTERGDIVGSTSQCCPQCSQCSGKRLPTRGPELHIVIIVGFVLFIVVAVSAVLLYKYIARLSYHWHEQQVDEGMTRAINIYTSQERLREPDLAYLRPGGGVQQATKAHAVESVHSNGRFRQLDGPSLDKRDVINRKSAALNSNAGQSLHEPQNQPLIGYKEPSASFQPARLDLQSAASPCLGADLGDTASLGGCDIPPSYEEALGMPLATDVENNMDEEGMDIAVGGILELDYFNEGSGDPGAGRGGKGTKTHDSSDTFT